RHILCALILVVCDLIATRKVIASGQHNHEHFCNLCHCTRSVHGYKNTDFHNWERRTHTLTGPELQMNGLPVQHRLIGIPSFHKLASGGQNCFAFHILIWCVVVDPMHNLFLGLLKEHFTGLLGIDLPKEEKSAILAISFGPFPSNMSQKDKDGVEKLRGWLERPYTSIFPPDQEKAINKLMRPQRSLQPEVNRTGADTATQHATLGDPAWMTSIPSHLGSPSHGKLKADQWRIAGTVHLPLSLIRLWGSTAQDSGRSVRCRQILNATMSLVSAIIVATSQTITAENAEVYLTYMLDYLNNVKSLFPEYSFCPNHHMALHIYEFLLSFGPVHSWWTYPFERMIGIIQRMPNNGRIGELEETIAHAYTRAANLRTLPSRIGCPQVIENSRSILEHLIASQARNSLSTDIQALSDQFKGPTAQLKCLQSSVFTPELRSAFVRAGIPIETRAQSLSHLTINGLTYATSSKHAGNSCALVLFPGSQQVVPCQIAYIIQYEVEETTKLYLGVRHHKPASIICDPYLQYTALRAKIWDSGLDNLEVTEMSSIQSHFACLPLCVEGKDLVVVISLSRVILID
ncbi:LOW QUALITY PROTEIN: hypothetical protein CVT26_005423, partial [Gymnopilus dilepis]